MALTKADLIEKVQVGLGFSKKQCTDLTEAMIETIKVSLENGDDVLISGFGKFCVKEKDQRRGRNPATGDELTLRPRKVVTLKCSDKLREKVNKA